MTERTDWTKTPGPHSATSYADSKTTIVFALPTLPPLPFLPLYWVQPHVIGSHRTKPGIVVWEVKEGRSRAI